MYKFGFSLILYNKVHINKFKDYSIKTIIANLKSTLNKKDKIIFYLSTNRKSLKVIINILQKNLGHFNWQIEYDLQAEELLKKKFSYIKLGKIQAKHAKKIINKKTKYLCFLYSDIIYSNSAFRECINILKRKSAVGSFAISLSINKSFKIFYKKLLKNNHLSFLLKNSNLLISNFHKKYIYNSNNYTEKSNLIIYLNKNLLLIKSLHFHPILIRTDKIKKINISSLDTSFFNLFSSNREIYIEKKMKRFSIFSFDDSKLKRNQKNYKNYFQDSNLSNDLLLLNLHNSIKNEQRNSNIFFENYQSFSNYNENLIFQTNKNLNYLLSKKNIKIKVKKIIIDKNKLIFNNFNIITLISIIKNYVILNNFVSKSFLFKKLFYDYFKKYFHILSNQFFFIENNNYLRAISNLRYSLFINSPFFFIKKYVLYLKTK